MGLTGRLLGLRYRANAIFSSVIVVDVKYAHVNALFSMFWAVELLSIKISTSSASNRGCRWRTIKNNYVRVHKKHL